MIIGVIYLGSCDVEPATLNIHMQNIHMFFIYRVPAVDNGTVL